MEIQVSEEIVRIVTIRLSGRVDAFVAQPARAALDAEVERGIRHFLCDLSDVEFLDSAGMAVLVSLLKRARQAGGDVKLVLPRAEAALRILRLTKFDRVFDTVDPPADAVRSFLR